MLNFIKELFGAAQTQPVGEQQTPFSLEDEAFLKSLESVPKKVQRDEEAKRSSAPPIQPNNVLLRQNNIPPRNKKKEIQLNKILYLGGVLGLENWMLESLDKNFDAFWEGYPNVNSTIAELDVDQLTHVFSHLDEQQRQYIISYMRQKFSENVNSPINQYHCFVELWNASQDGFNTIIHQGRQLQEDEDLHVAMAQITEQEAQEAQEAKKAAVAAKEAQEKAAAAKAAAEEAKKKAAAAKAAAEEAKKEAAAAKAAAEEAKKKAAAAKAAAEEAKKNLYANQPAVENPLNLKHQAEIVRLKRELYLLLGKGEEVPACLENIQQRVNWGSNLNEAGQKQALQEQFTIIDNYRRSAKSYSKEGLFSFVQSIKANEVQTVPLTKLKK